MSDSDSSSPAAPDGFGARLAQAREAQGLSIPEMAARLRLHPKQVAALEEERLESLPEPAFVRGFLRNYAKELRLDPGPLLDALAARQAPQGDIPTMIGGPPADVRHAMVERSSRLTIIIGVLVVIAVLGIVGWVASSRVARLDTGAASSGATAASGERGGASAGAVSAPVAPQTPATPGGDAVPATPAPASAPSSPQPSPAASPAPAPAAAPGAASGTADPAAAQAGKGTPSRAAAAAGGSALRIAVGDRPSWVEVTQADGRVLLTGLQEPGTERRLGPVQPPLRLVIGNASSVTLEYKGRSIDLQPHVRANDLARLSLD